MKIQWLGHSCFKVTSKGYTIILDPYGAGSVPGLADLSETANQVICSHGHFDHNAENLIMVNPKDSCPFTITSLASYHDEVKGAKRGPNKLTILDDGETKLAHLGDIGCDLTEDQIEMLTGVDVLLIPVGGIYTIDADQAADIVAQLAPMHVIPMHYSSPDFGFSEIGPVDAFAGHFDQVSCENASAINTDNLPAEQVIVLVPERLRK